RLEGKLAEGATATDLVLTVTEQLRQHGVVGKFVEFFGPGLASLTLADRATIANMAPEYGATCGIFPVDAETVRYLKLSGRSDDTIALVETYMKAMGLWHDETTAAAQYSATLTLDLGDVVPSIAGPKRPQDRIALTSASSAFDDALAEHQKIIPTGGRTGTGAVQVTYQGETFQLDHGSVVIAAITSCTNTSNPAVLIAAGLLARNARALGLTTKPWVKTSLAPGSKVVTDYLSRTNLLDELEALGFYLVGYGCTTCIGNSGPLPVEIEDAIRSGNLLATSVLSGNRNFEGRIHQEVRANYLASPPLVVAYALAGSMTVDLYNDPLGVDGQGQPVYLKDIWPDDAAIAEVRDGAINAEMFRTKYSDVYTGNETWNQIPVAEGNRYDWPTSTYVQQPPFFENIANIEPGVSAIVNARCLVKVSDSVTTDHISPAGAIAETSPAGGYLSDRQVPTSDYNSYGSRRGNHEVMMRGTFANVRLKNELAPGTEGSWSLHFPSGEQVSIFEAAERYRETETPLIVLSGKEYGTGSSRDWAAKGPALLGVRAVIAESYERIHRSNLVGMGVLPLQYGSGDSAESLGLDGSEAFSIPAIQPGQKVATVTATRTSGERMTFETVIRIDTPNEYAYYENGGILHYVLRRLAGNA
ncbi:MAG: aconitate hydratase AcnA, partial [Planctomycetota bacterium]